MSITMADLHDFRVDVYSTDNPSTPIQQVYFNAADGDELRERAERIVAKAGGTTGDVFTHRDDTAVSLCTVEVAR